MYEITKAARSDAADVLALYRSLVGTPGCAWDDEYPCEETIDEDLAADGLYIIKENGDIIAAATLAPGENTEFACWSKRMKNPAGFFRVGVRSDRQGHGIAKLLLTRLGRDAEDLGFDGITLLASKTNPSALSLYRSLGFVRCGECFLYDTDWFTLERELGENATIYREITAEEATPALLHGFDRYQEVKRCWRKSSGGEWELKDIAFTESWGDARLAGIADEFKEALDGGGHVYGAFGGGGLLGFATVINKPLGSRGQYIQLDNMQVTYKSRGEGIGKRLFYLAADAAKLLGGEKMYISAHSSEESQAFYRRMGCVDAEETDPRLFALEPFDVHMEYAL